MELKKFYHITFYQIPTAPPYFFILLFILFHIFNNSIPDDRFRDIIFEVISQTDIIERFDTLKEYWEKFGVRDKSLEKKLKCFEIESIDNPCQIGLAINPKEIYEHFEDFANNRKHKGKKKIHLE